MDSLEIFDKDGKALNIEDVIYNYIKAKAESSNKSIEEVYVGVWIFKKTWLQTYEAIDNGYDAIDLCEFGKEVEIKNI
jgi:hypothetical protein